MQKQFHLIKQQTVTELSYYPAMMLYAIGSLLKQLDFFDDVCYLNNNNNINDYVSRLLRNYRTFRSYTQGIKQFFSTSKSCCIHIQNFWQKRRAIFTRV